jgi:RNA recognition motif-containing protein
MAPFLDSEGSQLAMSSPPTSPDTHLREDSADSSSPASISKKRKRETKPIPEIEVDIEAPEPPSKKALRKAKKGKPVSKQPVPKFVDTDHLSDSEDVEVPVQATPVDKSKYGIWIGNLPWTVTKVELQEFFTSNGRIEKESITRIHMPLPAKATIDASRQKKKPQNKGFAYVDFATEDAFDRAIVLSETLLAGRKVLIKDAKSFEGRPEPAKEGEGIKTGVPSGKASSKRIFVGNLAFDTTREELQEHFARCGEVADVFIATFEDTGKCKGYGWITFEDLESAEKAVRGWVEIKTEDESGDDEEEELEKAEKVVKKEEEREKPDKVVKKKPKRKWWINRIKGRALRMEFAEDKATRYKKRFGKGAKEKPVGEEPLVESTSAENIDFIPHSPKENSRKVKPTFKGRTGKIVQESATTVAAALTGVERLTGQIVQGRGKKITFD